MTKLDRLARSLPDARDLLDGLTKRNVKLTSSAAQSMDRTDPRRTAVFNVLAMVAEVRIRPDPTAHPGGEDRENRAGFVVGIQSSRRTRPSTCSNCTTLFSITLHKAWLPSVRAGLGTLQAHDPAGRRFSLNRIAGSLLERPGSTSGLIASGCRGPARPGPPQSILCPPRLRADLLLSGAEVVAAPRSCGQGCLHFVSYGERQQALSVLSDLGDPVLSSTPPPVVGLFGGRHVASPCSARR